MSSKMEFDAGSFSFRKAGTRVKEFVTAILTFMFVTVSLSVMVYVAFSLIWNTDEEKRLKEENRMYEKKYEALVERAALLESTIAHLQHEDNAIYGDVFHSVAPELDPMAGLALFNGSDTIPAASLVHYSYAKSDSLSKKSVKVEQAFRKAFKALSDRNVNMPPMRLPLKDITYSQVGASVGLKMNPFLKAEVEHRGLDFIVSRGTPVYAPAAGEVITVTNDRTDGRKIEILHSGGYITEYSHLDEFSVRRGQVVREGQKIGTVGMSGKSYAPHLHYGIRNSAGYRDPVNYIFASVTPAEYADMLFMSVNTKQSMD